jgi:hypothetical protein
MLERLDVALVLAEIVTSNWCRLELARVATDDQRSSGMKQQPQFTVASPTEKTL